MLSKSILICYCLIKTQTSLLQKTTTAKTPEKPGLYFHDFFKVAVDMEYAKNMYELHKKAKSTAKIVGW